MLDDRDVIEVILEEDPTFSWPLAKPELKVSGKDLVDPCGNPVLLHGVAMTPTPGFNGGHIRKRHTLIRL